MIIQRRILDILDTAVQNRFPLSYYSPVTSYQSPVTSYQSPITFWTFWTTLCRTAFHMFFHSPFTSHQSRSLDFGQSFRAVREPLSIMLFGFSRSSTFWTHVEHNRSRLYICVHLCHLWIHSGILDTLQAHSGHPHAECFDCFCSHSVFELPSPDFSYCTHILDSHLAERGAKMVQHPELLETR